MDASSSSREKEARSLVDMTVRLLSEVAALTLCERKVLSPPAMAAWWVRGLRRRSRSEEGEGEGAGAGAAELVVNSNEDDGGGGEVAARGVLGGRERRDVGGLREAALRCSRRGRSGGRAVPEWG